MQVTFTLDMSIGPNQPRKYARRFSQNLGKSVTRVFSGRIQLPKITKTTRPGWIFRIPLQRPFLITKLTGPSLVLDFHTTAVVSKVNQRAILLQGTPDYGSLKFQGFGVNCHVLKVGFSAQFPPGWIYPGSYWSWGAGSLLPKAPGFLMLGDAGWGSKWAGLTLPVNLKMIGAPKCTLDVRPFLILPFVVDQRGGARVQGFWLPKDPRLANVKLYYQAAYAHPKANALGWLLLGSLEQRIGTGEDHHGASLGASNYTSSVTHGTGLLGDPVPWCRITY